MAKPIAALSLDLDNLWAYRKTGALPGWEDFPSYFELAVPRLLSHFDRHGLAATVFVVGQDAALPANRAPLATIARAGHEIGNHSFFHEPWLNRQPPHAIAAELARAHAAIGEATGQGPIGFRGPGFSLSTAILAALLDLGYRYDASTFPTFIGPAARAYYFLRSGFSAPEQNSRAHLFGTLADGLRPLKPYGWALPQGRLVELPVTTIPAVRAPFHFTYLSFLATRSPALARRYFCTALGACRLLGVAPSLLLHPLDVLGPEDIGGLGGFPGMGLAAAPKRALLDFVLAQLNAQFRVVTLAEHCAHAQAQGLAYRRPAFAADTAPLVEPDPVGASS